MLQITAKNHPRDFPRVFQILLTDGIEPDGDPGTPTSQLCDYFLSATQAELGAPAPPASGVRFDHEVLACCLAVSRTRLLEKWGCPACVPASGTHRAAPSGSSLRNRGVKGLGTRAQGSAALSSAPLARVSRSREAGLRYPSEGALHLAQVMCWWIHIQPCFQHHRASQYSLLEPKLGLLNVRLGSTSRPVYPPDSSKRDGHVHLPPTSHPGAAAPRAHSWAPHAVRKPRITPIGQPRPPARGQNPRMRDPCGCPRRLPRSPASPGRTP